MQTDITIPTQDAPVTIVTQLQGLRWPNLLAIQFACAEHVERLIQVAQWVRVQATESGQWPDGMRVSMLAAVVEVPQARVWPLAGGGGEDFPEDGVVTWAIGGPPADPSDGWPTPLFRVQEDGLLDVEGDGAEWGQIDLYSIREQLR